MDFATLAVVLLVCLASIAGTIVLCNAIEHRNRREARRERFGLAAVDESWP